MLSPQLGVRGWGLGVNPASPPLTYTIVDWLLEFQEKPPVLLLCRCPIIIGNRKFERRSGLPKFRLLLPLVNYIGCISGYVEIWVCGRPTQGQSRGHHGRGGWVGSDDSALRIWLLRQLCRAVRWLLPNTGARPPACLVASIRNSTHASSCCFQAQTRGQMGTGTCCPIHRLYRATTSYHYLHRQPSSVPEAVHRGGTLARRARAGHLFGPVPHR